METQKAASSSTRRPSMVGGVAEYDGWARTGLSLRAEFEKNEGGIAWQAAKWLVDGYTTFLGPDASNQEKGRLIRDASRYSGLSRNTLITYIKVGIAFPDGPVLGLSFAHHRAVILVPGREDRAYWLRQAASKEMSVSDLKKVVKDLVPSRPKVGINTEQEVTRYSTRLKNLNPKDYVWDKVISEIDMGNRSLDFPLLRRDIDQCAEGLLRNLRQIDGALAGRLPVVQGVQQRIKSPQLVDAEKTEAIGATIQAA